LQEQAPNHLKLRWLRAGVVSVKEKSWLKTVAGEVQGDEQPRTTDEVSKLSRRCQNWRLSVLQDNPKGDLLAAWGPSLQKFISLDRSIHWANPFDLMMPGETPATTPPYLGPHPEVVHLHGAEVPSSFDDGTAPWRTPGGEGTVNVSASATAHKSFAPAPGDSKNFSNSSGPLTSTPG
jgi:hypothetical protein